MAFLRLFKIKKVVITKTNCKQKIMLYVFIFLPNLSTEDRLNET